MYSTYITEKLFSGKEDEDPYAFNEVRMWSNRIVGGIASQEELYIPINVNRNHWNFIRIKMKEKVIELWDSLGERVSNDKLLKTAERFIKYVMSRELAEGRVTKGAQWQQRWSREDKS